MTGSEGVSNNLECLSECAFVVMLGPVLGKPRRRHTAMSEFCPIGSFKREAALVEFAEMFLALADGPTGCRLRKDLCRSFLKHRKRYLS